MCYCSFAIGQFLILKNQSKRQTFELLFKVQISPDVFTVIPPFVNLTVLSMEFPIRNCLPFLFQNRWEFLSDYLVTYSGQKSQQIADKKIQMSSEIKLLAGTKVYDCFNFKVNQL